MQTSAQHGPTGKTTLLRDVVGLLANTFNKRVVVVDTSNEIGGDGAVPHSCLGKARRMPVHDQSRQHEVLLQAVQNHNPQVQVWTALSSSQACRHCFPKLKESLALIKKACLCNHGGRQNVAFCTM